MRRIFLQPGARRLLASPAHYGLFMVIGGALSLDGEQLDADQSVLLPASWRGGLIENEAHESRYLLLAYPRV